ncbi:ECF transporter S component [Vallitalea pronyensis]|uniref:ECF transporter S component n=1 Tax=Vallitalea pronyensis TaxID=1348613 RepID=A0A8J8MGJ9_9FIRM|nr:ECF transporter S component [Vallitalea pronyensis]QUI21199.1 ECF transporter S component [Vallitalea pronyensis]
MNKKYATRDLIAIIVQTGLLIAIAQVVKLISSTYIYIAGAPAIRISFSGPFTGMPGILFGPLVGGIAGGLGDIIGYLLRPQGAYIPWFTVTAILGGVLTPIFWITFRKVNVKRLQTTCIVLFGAMGMLGIFNHIMVTFLPDNGYASYLLGLGKNKAFTTLGLEVTAAVGFLLLFVDYVMKKKLTANYVHDNFLKLLISVGISGLIVTTLNTQILRIFIPALSQKAFIAFWIPRVIEELFMSVYIAYMLSFLLHLYHKVFKPNRFM